MLHYIKIIRTPIILFLFLLPIVLCGCSDEESVGQECPLSIDPEAHLYEFVHISSGEPFFAWTAKDEVIELSAEQLDLPEEERNMHINGRILELPEGCQLNAQWSWYFDPNDWSLTDFSIEVCDGNPQYVEENLDEFVNNVGRYCPWGSRVVREVD